MVVAFTGNSTTMDEPHFFERAGPLTLSELARAVGAAALIGNEAQRVSDIAPLGRAGGSDITFLEDRRQRATLAQSKAAACLIKDSDRSAAPDGMALLIVADPSLARAAITALFYPASARPDVLFPGASAAFGHIDPAAMIEAGAVIEAGAMIGAGAEIGAGTVIGPRAVIGQQVRIGRDCYIGPNVVLQHALLGNRVIIHPGCLIGQDGFGYVMGRKGHTKIPQIGRVIIQDDVEIGAGTTIDRGALDDTIIGEGTKIDNQVQIGHNVVVGRHCVIVAKVGISGSCRIGDFVAIGGGAGLADHLTIGAGARIGAAAGLMHDVPAGETWLGAPAKPARTFFREVSALSKLAAPGKQRKGPGEEGGGNEH